MTTLEELEAAFNAIDRGYSDHYGSAKPKERKELDRLWAIADRALALAIKNKFLETNQHIKDLTRDLGKARDKLEEDLDDLKSAADVIGAVGDVVRLMASLGTLIAG